MRMQEVCKKTGLTKKAIHYYIDCGLITVHKSNNNYYDFTQEDVDKLIRISFLRSMDVRIDTIKKIFASPTAVNFFLIEERNELFREVKEKMNALMNLTSVILDLPHNARPEDLPITISSQNELVNSILLQIPQDLNYRMLSIYIFTPYTDEFATEYKKYLWKKIEEAVHQEFHNSSFQAIRYFSMKNNGEKMLKKSVSDYKKFIDLYHCKDLKPFVSAFTKQLEAFLSSEEAIDAFCLNQETIYLPTLQSYQVCAKEVLKEFSKRFSVCSKRIEKIILLTEKELKDTELKKDLYQKCHLSDENFGTSLFLLFLFNPIDYIL